MYIFYLILATAVILTFKENSYTVKEDDEVFNVTVQKFGVITDGMDLDVQIRTKTVNPTDAIRMYIICNYCVLVTIIYLLF